MEMAIAILKEAANKMYAEYQRTIYSVHYGQLIGKDQVELGEIRKTAAEIWKLAESITEQIKELQAERVEA
jgi:hypothetical protein